jgi:cardiolipin synthase
VLSLPNLLTLSRIVAVPLLVAFLWWPDWEGGYGIAFVLYCLMGITDYFDGYLARSSGAVSRLGIFLDPIADKIMVAAVILILVGTRDIAGIHVIAATMILSAQLAKWKTTLQLVSLGGIILGGAVPHTEWVHDVGIVALWGAAVLTLITGWDYLRVGLKHMD